MSGEPAPHPPTVLSERIKADAEQATKEQSIAASTVKIDACGDSVDHDEVRRSAERPLSTEA
jgi:hypothetical protein